MFAATLKTALRVLKSQPLHSILRFLSMAIGIAAFILTFLYVNYEYSYDSFHPHADTSYRLGRMTNAGTTATTSFALIPALQNDFPDYQFTHFFKDRSKSLFRKGENSFYESSMIWADEAFLGFFDFDDFIGDRRTALSKPYSLVVTESAALKYFERTPRLGETIELKWNEEYQLLEITGIIPDWPDNMHINFDFIVSFKTAESIFPKNIVNSWQMNYCYSYVRLPAEVKPGNFEGQFESFVKKHVNDIDKSYQEYLGFLQPLTLIHTQPEILSQYTNVINPTYLKLGIAIGLLVLVIASVNFITFNVVQFHARSKEIGVRKAIGATRFNVIMQFVLETTVVVMASMILGLVCVHLVLTPFNEFLHVAIEWQMIYTTPLLFVYPGLIILITIATGLYPSIYFSSQNIAGTFAARKSKSAVSFRRTLLTMQFLIAAILISFSVLILDQLNYVNAKAPGYNRDQMIYIPHGRRLRDNPSAFKTEALNHATVEAISLSFYKPTEEMNFTIDIELAGMEPQKIYATSVDEDFFDTYQIGFIEGENFSNNPDLATSTFIVNEAAVRELGLDKPIGSILKTKFQTGSPTMPVESRQGPIIGVVKDVHFESLRTDIKPMLFMVKPYWYYYVNVRLGKNMGEGIAHLKRTWNEMFPDRPFEFYFLDQDFQQLYEKENRLAEGLMAMTFLAIVTMCFGLFGYVQYISQQRTKEVGIRKVLGAGVFQIARLLSRDVVTSILIATVVSVPIFYYLGTQWLQNFAFHTRLTLLPSIISLVVLTSLSILTVQRQLRKTIQMDVSTVLRHS